MRITPGNSATATALLNGNLSTLPDGTTASWSSSDSAIATVAQNESNPLSATVTGVAQGTVTITCSIVDHNAGAQSVTGSATQIIDAAPVAITSVAVSVG